LTSCGGTLKIKIVESQKREGTGETQFREADPLILRPSPRVRHRVDAELWIFEDQNGQTYLAVKSKRFQLGAFASHSAAFDEEDDFAED
jgi:hypothetical protein